MPKFSLDYDINFFYQALQDLLTTFWPIISWVLGLGLAILVISGIAYITQKIR